MKERDIQNIVLSGFQDELKNKVPTYYYEMFMLTLRSIYPDIKTDSNNINYERFTEELKLWKHYRRGGNEAVNEVVLRNRKTDLFDESSFVRIVPVFLVNQNIDKAVKIAFDNIFYFTENIDNIFSTISFGILLSNDMKNIKLEESLEILKESIISFRTADYLKDTEKLKDNIYIIKIESKKIEIIQAIDRLIKELSEESEESEETDTRPEVQETIINLIEELSKKDIEKVIKPFIYRNVEIENKYISSIGSYIYKLRKGRVPSESLIFNKKEEVSIFTLQEGQKFNNSVLGESLLEKITVENGFELRFVKSKSGKYRFFKKL